MIFRGYVGWVKDDVRLNPHADIKITRNNRYLSQQYSCDLMGDWVTIVLFTSTFDIFSVTPHSLHANATTEEWQVVGGKVARFPLYLDSATTQSHVHVTFGGVPTTWMSSSRTGDVLWIEVKVPHHIMAGHYPLSVTLTDSHDSRKRTTIRLTLQVHTADVPILSVPALSITPRWVAVIGCIGVVLWLGFSFWWGSQAHESASGSVPALALDAMVLPPLPELPVAIEAQWAVGLATPTVAPTPTLRPSPTPLPPMPTPQPPPPTPAGRSAESFVDGAYTYERMFQEVGAQFGVDWRLLASIAQRESSLRPDAIGGSGEQGMMQLMPGTWNEFAPHVGEHDPFNPYASTRVAAYYLVYLRDYLYSQGYTESYWLLVAYNWGPNNLRRHLADGGDWGSIPTLRQNYAYTIVNRINDDTDPLWTETVRQEVPQ
jgi:soluble lytic murein transglycosylase-like protein